MHFLEIPPEVLGRADARELVRFWVCDGEKYVVLKSDLFGQKEPEVWGSVAADVLKHAMIAMQLNDASKDSSELYRRMIEAFQTRMADQGANHEGRLEL